MRVLSSLLLIWSRRTGCTWLDIVSNYKCFSEYFVFIWFCLSPGLCLNVVWQHWWISVLTGCVFVDFFRNLRVVCISHLSHDVQPLMPAALLRNKLIALRSSPLSNLRLPADAYYVISSVSELTFFGVIGNSNYFANLKFQIQFQFRLFKKNKFQFQIQFQLLF